MQTVESLEELRRIRSSMEGAFGLVPTMGALHAGHYSLVAKARAECRHVGVSIFVNPAQFGAGEDLANYPRNMPRDLSALESLGVDVVWTPDVASIYPPGYRTWIAVDEISATLEGACRPGHFRGVATVVAKLFNAFLPDKAYFGQKDAQQVAVLRRMARDLNFPVELVVCPTVREPDGLAMSSRNVYLNPRERQAATVLYRSLAAAREAYDRGERNGEVLRGIMRTIVGAEPLACPQYVSAADPETLGELEKIDNGVLLSLAVKIGKTRLIDNILISPGDK